MKPWQDPEVIPVLIHRKHWVILSATGGYDEVEPPVRELE